MITNRRVGILYESRIRNDGAPLYFNQALKRIEGLEVIHAIPNGNYSKVGKVDLWIWPDYGEDGLSGYVNYEPTLPNDGVPLAYFASDTHLGRDYRFWMASKADYVFFAQKRAVDEYETWSDHPKKEGQKVFWLPHAVEPSCYRPGVWTGEKWIDAVPKKEFDVCFVGHLNNEENYNGLARIDFLDVMFKEFPNFYYGSRSPLDPTANLFEDVANKFNRSKIVLNISIKDDINMRVFETLATKSFMLTNELPTFEDIGLIPGKHFATYNSYEEAITKAKYYLNHEEEAQAIAQAGYEEVINNHTYLHRVQAILDVAFAE